MREAACASANRQRVVHVQFCFGLCAPNVDQSMDAQTQAQLKRYGMKFVISQISLQQACSEADFLLFSRYGRRFLPFVFALELACIQ